MAKPKAKSQKQSIERGQAESPCSNLSLSLSPLSRLGEYAHPRWAGPSRRNVEILCRKLVALTVYVEREQDCEVDKEGGCG